LSKCFCWLNHCFSIYWHFYSFFEIKIIDG
jgi:hypothetical protein